MMNNKNWTPKVVLAISPHADDIELGAGGAIHKWISNGTRVVSVVFSTGKQYDIRLPEIVKAGRLLKIQDGDMIVWDYSTRIFPLSRQQILNNLIELRKNIEPDLVLVPTTTDRHQDHEVITAEAIRAFKKTSLLGYEVPWNMTQASLPMTVILSDRDIEAKQRAVAAHKTEQSRPYISKMFVISLARVRGLAVGQEYGESYEVIRWVM